MKIKCLSVICALWIFVCAEGFLVETKIEITVSVLRNLHVSSVCFVHSDHKGKSDSVARVL